MIVGNIRIIANRNRQLENQFGILKLQADLNQYYKQAQKKALGKFFEPIKPVKPKEQMTLEDIQGELKRKLSKFMLDDMYNMVDKFIRDYLVGASRLRASQMNELVNVFISRKLRAEQPVVVGSGIGRPLECRGGALPVVKSKYLSGGQRRALVESLKLAGNDALR